MKTRFTYTCEFCGHTSTDEEEIERCEASHFPLNKLELCIQTNNHTFQYLCTLEEETRSLEIAETPLSVLLPLPFSQGEIYPSKLHVFAKEDDGSFQILEYAFRRTVQSPVIDELSDFNARVTLQKQERKKKIRTWAKDHPLPEEARVLIKGSYPEGQQWRAPLYDPWTSDVLPIDRSFERWAELVTAEGSTDETLEGLRAEWNRFKESQLG